MDNPTRWNITNSAQNIVSALVDPSKQFDYTFRREWSNSFSGFSRHKPSLKGKIDNEFKSRLTDYLSKIEERKHIKKFDSKSNNESDNGCPNASSADKQQTGEILSVPNVFMQEDFDLSNLRTFTRVINSVSSSSDTNGLANALSENSTPYHEDHDYTTQDNSAQELINIFTKRRLKELQSNFTDYLDIIEENLASQISNRSGDFFQVMSSVDSVMEELSMAIKSVTNLRKKCSLLNESLVSPKMQNVHLIRTRDNAKNALDKMKDIAYLCKVQHMIQLLLSASDYSGALDLIEKSRSLLHNDLTRVVCLKHLESQLVEVERVIGLMMFQEFGFATGFSEISERNSLTLLSVLQTQAEKFVNEFHEERKKRLESTLDGEQWKMVDQIPEDFQRLISLLVDERKSISETFTLTNQQQQLKTHSRNPSDATINSALDSNVMGSGEPVKDNVVSGTSNGTVAPQQQVSALANNEISLSPVRLAQQRRQSFNNIELADGSNYVIVNSVITLVQIVMDYCKCAHDIRSLSSDLLERLFTILRLYNSKTYHLVYSAGAIQVAGLKTITTRRLFVSQRSLKLIILLIPTIKRHFTNLLHDDSRLRRFDEIKLSYEEHAGKIPERVNSIVNDVIDSQLQQWDAKPPVPSAQFTAVAQHLMRLHDNIQDVLPPDELRLLFLKISQTFKDILLVHLKRLNINNETGPQQWIVTQELTFYKLSSAKLSVFRGWELNFDDIWTRLNSISANTSSNLPNDTAAASATAPHSPDLNAR